MSYLGLYKLIIPILVGAITYTIGVTQQPQALTDTNLPADPIYKEGLIYAPILMYHHVAPKIRNSPYYVSPDIFEQQMAWLKVNNYNVISLDRFYRGVYEEELLPPRPVVLTFDDGDRDQYTNAFPVLKKYGFNATFYVITNSIEGESYVTWEMLKEMVKDGMDIGSHTVHHPSLGISNEAQTELELRKSKAVLEKKLGITVKHLAYPGGSYSQLTIDALPKLGYLTATTVKHTQYHSPSLSQYEIGRMHIDSDMESFAGFVTGRRKD